MKFIKLTALRRNDGMAMTEAGLNSVPVTEQQWRQEPVLLGVDYIVAVRPSHSPSGAGATIELPDWYENTDPWLFVTESFDEIVRLLREETVRVGQGAF